MRKKQGCPLSPLLFIIVLEVLPRAISQEKEINDIQIRKKDRKFLFPDDMILYIEIPKYPTNKLVKIINKFSKVIGYKLTKKMCCVFIR